MLYSAVFQKRINGTVNGWQTVFHWCMAERWPAEDQQKTSWKQDDSDEKSLDKIWWLFSKTVIDWFHQLVASRSACHSISILVTICLFLFALTQLSAFNSPKMLLIYLPFRILKFAFLTKKSFFMVLVCTAHCAVLRHHSPVMSDCLSGSLHDCSLSSLHAYRFLLGSYGVPYRNTTVWRRLFLRF